ncbi:hypothetical protein D3C78_1470180 [compost metagenome]
MNDVAGDAGGDVETLGDVAVLRLAVVTAVGIALNIGDRNALANLNQRRHAIGGLNLLDAALTAGGAAADDAGLVWLRAVD